MNTRNRTHALLIGVGAALCMAATVSSADPQTAMSACVQAFVSSSLPKASKIQVRTPRSMTSRVLTFGRPSTIALTATSRTSGKQLATAVCNTNGSDTVITLNDSMPKLVAADTKANLQK